MYSDVVFFTDVDHLIVKHNSLIESKTDLSEVESKLVALAIVLVRLHEKDPNRNLAIDSTIRIYASDYVKAYSVTLNGAYTAINDALESLFNSHFRMNSIDGIPTDYHWIESKATGKKLNDGFVEFTFSKKAIELITGFDKKKGNYTSYGIDRISRLKGNYSGRIYEIIIQYKNTETDKTSKKKTTKIFDLEDFRLMLGIALHEYRKKDKPTMMRMDNFKKNVIDIPLSIINEHSDIVAEPRYHKTGKTITGISFVFEFKKDYVSSFTGKKIFEDTAELVDNSDEPGEMRTVGDETKDPKKNKPADKPAIPAVKNDKEHLGTDIRKEDIDKPNPVQEHIVEYKDLAKPVQQGSANKDPHQISEHNYKTYVDIGGKLSIEKLTEKCRASAKPAPAFMLGEIGRLRKEAAEK